MSGPMQWTPHGLVPVNGVRPTAPMDEDEDDELAPAPAAPPPPQRATPPIQSKPINVVALARRRLREIKSELRRMRQLERERDELQRLVDAASNRRPRAVVKTIARAAS